MSQSMLRKLQQRRKKLSTIHALAAGDLSINDAIKRHTQGEQVISIPPSFWIEGKYVNSDGKVITAKDLIKAGIKIPPIQWTDQTDVRN